MPTYEYACQDCGHEFETFQSITARVLRKCPECGKPKLKRLIGTGAGVIFKGSGFYETDYRSDSYKKAEKAEKDASSGKKDDGGKDKKDAGATKSETSTKTEKKKESKKNPK
ncbi:MAG: FmdB family transcriptional regulator [Phycisphaeraceae bacterium]|nr:FmdB family transcriptional regulator [Phycisphaeraceae bacterium]